MNRPTKNEVSKPTDAVKAKVIDHVVIRDKKTGKELINKRG